MIILHSFQLPKFRFSHYDMHSLLVHSVLRGNAAAGECRTDRKKGLNIAIGESLKGQKYSQISQDLNTGQCIYVHFEPRTRFADVCFHHSVSVISRH